MFSSTALIPRSENSGSQPRHPFLLDGFSLLQHLKRGAHDLAGVLIAPDAEPVGDGVIHFQDNGGILANLTRHGVRIVTDTDQRQTDNGFNPELEVAAKEEPRNENRMRYHRPVVQTTSSDRRQSTNAALAYLKYRLDDRLAEATAWACFPETQYADFHVVTRPAGVEQSGWARRR